MKSSANNCFDFHLIEQWDLIETKLEDLKITSGSVKKTPTGDLVVIYVGEIGYYELFTRNSEN